MGSLVLCLILQGLSTPLSAASFPSCVKKSSSTYQEPPTLAALIKCHKEKLEAARLDFAKAHGVPPADLAVERWEDMQRAEVRDYLRRHEDQASLDEPTGTTLVDEGGGADKAPEANGDGEAGLDKDFESSLKEKSQGGKHGITPGMAKDIVEYLQRKQGGVSPEMKDLLQTVKSEGANLSDATILQIKMAAQKANRAGIDLKVDRETERFLLEPDKPPQSTPDAH